MKTLLALLATACSLLAARFTLDASRHMPRHVSAGSHNLRMLIAGQGSPAVVFECSGLAQLEIWNRVQPAVSRFATTVCYDHAGYWGSEPGPKPRDAQHIAQELHQALTNARVAPPYVLVGYSFGGPYARVFASLYPDEIAGLVLVDPTQEDFMEALSRDFPELVTVSEARKAEQGEWGCQWDSLTQARNAPLPRVPMTLMTGMKAHDVLTRHLLPQWLAAHAKWLQGFPGSRHVVTTNSGHGIPFTEPNLVIEAIRETISRSSEKE